jgi:hypothetical protein
MKVDLLVLLGAAAIIGGVAAFDWRAAVIVFGVACVLSGLFLATIPERER